MVAVSAVVAIAAACSPICPRTGIAAAAVAIAVVTVVAIAVVTVVAIAAVAVVVIASSSGGNSTSDIGSNSSNVGCNTSSRSTEGRRTAPVYPLIPELVIVIVFDVALI